VNIAPARPGARLSLYVAILVTLMVVVAAPVSAADTEVHRVVGIAKDQRGDPWSYGAVGPAAFDCSGFVYYSFRRANLLERIGGARRSAQGYWDWFAHRGRASRTHGRRGDLVIWGGGRHIGIYLGHGRAISALTSGVTIHRLHGLSSSFTTFLHVRLEGG